MNDGFVGGRFGDLVDDSFDGQRSLSNLLSGGLGQLTDGIRGHENLKVNAGYEWIGWRSMNDSVDIIFDFGQPVNLTSASVHVHNLFRKGVEVFSAARASFSLDGHTWSQSPLEYEYLADHRIEAPRDVLIHLHGRVGRHVRLSLAFAAKWLLVSEVTFDILPVALDYVPDVKDLESPFGVRIRTNPWKGASKSTLHSVLVLVGIGLLALTLSVALTVFVYRMCFSHTRKSMKQPHCLYSVDVDGLMNSGMRTALHGGGAGGAGSESSSNGPVYCEPDYRSNGCNSAGGLFGSAGRVTKIYKDHSSMDHEYAVPDVVYKDALSLMSGRAGLTGHSRLIHNPLSDSGDVSKSLLRPLTSSVPSTTLYIDKSGSVLRTQGKPIYQIWSSSSLLLLLSLSLFTLDACDLVT